MISRVADSVGARHAGSDKFALNCERATDKSHFEASGCEVLHVPNDADGQKSGTANMGFMSGTETNPIRS